LAPLSGEHLPGSTVDGDDAQLDISARGFWQKGQHAFFDIRVFNPFAATDMNQNLTASFITAEREKKRQYNRRVLEVEYILFYTTRLLSVRWL